ncbi:MAG: sugar ABC transporter substrate-binding protein, partial [Dehalococcoidales bacterium]|nr:sugar ABC transporter substrate-binding protein [Dehalococcoidales bacterium]
MKRIILLMMTVLLTLALFVGCANQTTSDDNEAKQTEEQTSEVSEDQQTTDVGEPEAGKKVLGVVMYDLVNQFFVDMVEGGNEAAEDFGVEVIWKSSDGNLDKQIALIENFTEQGVDCILVDPIDNVGITPAIEKAAAAGIPTITMAGDVDLPTNYNTRYGDYEVTKNIARILAHSIGEEGKVALLYGNKGNVVSDQRQLGFNDGMAEFPGIEVIEQPSNWDPANGLKVMQDIIAANPDLKAYHSVCGAVTVAAYQAVKTAEKTDSITVTSFDGNLEEIEAVTNGEFLLTVLVGAKRVGYWNIKIAALLTRGELPEEHTLNMPLH